MSTLDQRYFGRDVSCASLHTVYSFLTCRLVHSIPFSAREKLMCYRAGCAREFSAAGPEDPTTDAFAAHLFRFWDDVLGTSPGPAWLAHPAVAEFTQITLHAMEGVLCSLEGYVILPTHVHVLYSQNLTLRSGPTPMHVADALKTPVAHFATRVLDLRGPFWQGSDYHRILRSRRELRSVQRYIRRDPVRAGLVSRPDEWLWSWERE
jgi:hypothetical protein